MLEALDDIQGKVINSDDVIIGNNMITCSEGGFIITKHRIPEIVVPNLDGFEVSVILFGVLGNWNRSIPQLSLISLFLSPTQTHTISPDHS